MHMIKRTSIIGGMAAALLAITTPAQAAPVDRPAASCQSVNAEALPEDAGLVLMERGWFGDPTDSAERLYAPQCERKGVPAIPSITGPDGTVHHGCRVVLVSEESSVVSCADGWTEES